MHSQYLPPTYPKKFLQILFLILFTILALPELANATARYSCSDSDAGRDPQNPGIAVENDSITSAVHYGKDRCQGNILIENQCRGTRLISYRQSCQYGCGRQSLQMYGETYTNVGFCQPAPVCGNGVVEQNEACDDGNTSNDDGCSDVCQVENLSISSGPASCEESDGGQTPETAGVVVVHNNNTNTVEYQKDRCQEGNLIEKYCNDGNLAISTYQCQNGCSRRVIEQYGERFTNVGFCNDAPGGTANNTPPPPPPSPPVPSPFCGDGTINGNEECDDGNTQSGDGCSASCHAEASSPPPGTGTNPVPVCGDGVVNGNEECDDGNTNSGDGCSATCLVGPNSSACGSCALGTFCDLVAPGTFQCLTKKMVGDNCQFAGECMSGACASGSCQNGEAFSLCVMVNERAEDITDEEIKSFIARASDLAAEKFNLRIRILAPIYRYDVPFTPVNNSDKNAWLQTCYDDHRNDPPNGFLMMSGDTRVLAQAYWEVSQDLSSQGYCNRFYNSTTTSGHMIGTDMHGLPTAQRWYLANIFLHELLHSFGSGTNEDHLDSATCKATLGNSLWAEMIRMNAAGFWFSQCATAHSHLANGIRNACAEVPTGKALGSICTSNAECASNLCITQASGPLSFCYAGQLGTQEVCAFNQQCLSGACQAFRCAP